VLGFSLLFLPFIICGDMLEALKDKLKLELTDELPGEDAHALMMPILRDDEWKMPTFQNPPIASAVLILFYPDEYGHIKFPLIQRPTYNGAHSGQVSFPGGKFEDSDRDLVHTALREAEEEIGVHPEGVEVVGKLSDLHIAVSNFIVTPVIGFTNSKPQFTIDTQEVETVIESDLYDIINPAKRKEGTIMARGRYKIQTPYFDIDNRVVWGATAMMLSELSIVISKTGII
jgi:8-oxo-dGTP pyrophosphatase MutT (NUDIX family)